MESVVKTFKGWRVSFLHPPPFEGSVCLCVHKPKTYKCPSWCVVLWQVISDCVNHIALCYIKWHTVMWLIQHEMTHHCAKYHLENLGNYWGAEADLRLWPFKFWVGKTKEVKETSWNQTCYCHWEQGQVCSTTWIFSWVISRSVLKNALVPWGLTNICGSELSFSEPLGTSLIISVSAPYKQGCKLNATSFSLGGKKPFQNKTKTDCSFSPSGFCFPAALSLFSFLFLYIDWNLKYWDVSRPHRKVP